MAYPKPVPTAVVVECTAMPRQPMSYSGFRVTRAENREELALIYSGDPFMDFDEAKAYARSLSQRVLTAESVMAFWKELGVDLDKEVTNG